MRLARGSRALVPVVVFFIAMTVSTVGPGAVAATALIAPLAMAIGTRSGIPPFLSALMVANGANAGNLSPLSSVGVIANSKMASVGLGGHEWKVWAANFLAHAAVAAAAWLLFGGLKLARGSSETRVPAEEVARLGGRQWLTIAAITAWVAGVVFLKLNLGFSAFAAAIILIVFKAADESASIKRMPWNAILMISGISLLIGVLEKSGGMDLFTGLLARFATPGTIDGFIALVTGTISTYSSTSGVVLPTFLPTVPTLVAKVGGGDPLAVALSINVGASMVDVSPLSTIGALCVAAVTDTTTSRELFRKMLIWGLSMTVVGALLCQWLAGAFARM